MRYITLLLTNMAYSVYPYLTLGVIGYEDISKALTTLVSILGGAFALIGGIDAFSGYSNQSSGKQSEGIIKFIGDRKSVV